MFNFLHIMCALCRSFSKRMRLTKRGTWTHFLCQLVHECPSWYSIVIAHQFLHYKFNNFQILSRDSVTVSVDAVVYYRVSNPTVSVANVENAHHATRLLAQTSLRNILGTKNLSEILTEREVISNAMQVNHEDPPFLYGIRRDVTNISYYTAVM